MFCKRFIAHDSIYAKRAICYRKFVRPSVCSSVSPSVTGVDQSKTVEVRIMQFSYSSPIPLVFAG